MDTLQLVITHLCAAAGGFGIGAWYIDQRRTREHAEPDDRS